jgi:hypothetical protein
LTLCTSIFVFALAACGGDDDGSNLPDAEVPGDPDAADPLPSITSPEGGAIYIEHVTLSDDAAAAFGLAPENTFARSVAHFVNSMSPDSMHVPPFNACTDLYQDPGNTTGLPDWPNGIGDSVDFLDVGTMKVTGKNYANDAIELDYTLNTSGTDLFGRPIAEAYQVFQTGVTEYFKPGSSFTFEFGGSSEVDAQTWTDAAFIPYHFALINPGLNEDLTITSGTDVTIGWEEQDVPTNIPPNSGMGEVVALASPTTGGYAVACLYANDPDGAITIPGAMIESYRETEAALGGDPNVALLVRNYNNHHIMTLPNDDPNNVRRIDVVGIYCYVQFVTVDPAP